MGIPAQASPYREMWDAWHAVKNRNEVEWTKGDRVVDHVAWLDATVQSSGWIDVLSDSHDHIESVMESLEAIGAHETLGILQRSIECLPEGKLEFDEDEKNRKLDLLTQEDLQQLDRLDQDFYDSQEDLCGLAIKYRQSFLK